MMKKFTPAEFGRFVSEKSINRFFYFWQDQKDISNCNLTLSFTTLHVDPCVALCSFSRPGYCKDEGHPVADRMSIQNVQSVTVRELLPGMFAATLHAGPIHNGGTGRDYKFSMRKEA